jgi:signal transduction histidine kinase
MSVALWSRACEQSRDDMATCDRIDGTSLDELLRALDHDLRSPVANILGFVDLLRDSPSPVFTGEQLEFLGRIEDNCRILLEMFERLRATTR